MADINDVIKNNAKKTFDVSKIKDNLPDVSGVSALIFIIITVIIGGYLYWNYTHTASKNIPYNCARILEINNPGERNAIVNLPSYDNTPLMHYTVNTAYNCCATSNYQNTYVSSCAMINCINNGYRGLDFEVYLIDGEARVACSANETIHMKTTFNSLSLKEVFGVICKNAWVPLTINPDKSYTGTHCNTDPLIVIL